MLFFTLEKGMEIRFRAINLLATAVSVFFLATLVDSRQMCWSCQFVLNGRGKECMTVPANWTEGDPRMKCPTKCIITAEFDALSGDPTFFFRGCGDSTQEDGCQDNGARHSCFYSCEGEDYCNDRSLPTSPMNDDGSDGSGLESRLGPGTFLTLIFAIYLAVKFVIH